MTTIFETEIHPVGDRESWLRRRKQDITASEIGAVFGLHPYKTPLQLWADKTSELIENVDNAAMRRGRWLEDAVIAACRDQHPDWEITKPGIYVRAPAHRIGATPDAVANGGKIIVQCKTVAERSFKGWDDAPPAHYQLQALMEAMLLNAEHAILAVLITSAYGADYREYDVPRHPAAEARILEGVAKFWAQIEQGETPKPDYAADLEILGKLNAPDDALPPLDLSTDNYIGDLLERREALLAQKISIEAELDAIKGQVVEKLAKHTVALLPGWKITNKTQTRKAYTVKESSSAVLRITRTNAQEIAA